MTQKVPLITKAILSAFFILSISLIVMNFEFISSSTLNKINGLHWEIFDSIEYFTIFVNFLMLIFAKKLITEKDTLGDPVQDYRLKVMILRGMNIIFFIIFFVSFLFDKSIGASWIQSYLLILASFTFTHWINHWILIKYGDHETVDDEIRVTGNYIATILIVSVSLSSIIFSGLILINIWDMNNLLESGSAFVTIGIIIFATKEFWLEEFLSSFVIHAKGRLKRGSVIQLEDHSIYIMLETNFIGSRLKNHKTDVEISLPNSFFVRNKLKILSIEKPLRNKDETNGKKSKKEWKPIKQFIHFNIGYSSTHEEVKAYFDAVIEESVKQCNSIGSNYTLNLNSNDDHAVKWEFLYYINNPFHVLTSKNVINLVAFNKQKEFGIDLSTPVTYSKVSE